MKKNSIIYRISFFVIITAAIIFLSFKFKADLNSGEEGLKITKWENFYTGDNIHFYYLNPQNENLLKLKKTYSLDKLIDGKKDQFDNSIKIMEFINGKVKAQSNSMTSDKNALEIMQAADEGNKISDSDYATIYEECLASVGINVRSGVLRSTDKKNSGKSYFNVCEIWSVKYNKWIMIDGVNGTYMTDAEIPLSAIEIISKGIDKVKIAVLKDTNKYVKNMKNYYESYSISVDNNKYGELKSNSKLTFLKQGLLPKIETKEGFIQPTIFVNNPKVFKISPKKEYVNKGVEKIPTLIFAKRDLKNDTEEGQNFTVGAFMNSYMLKNYFLSVNGGDYIKVDTFFDLQIVKGVNSIKLSQDGKTLEREVLIEK
ncbi:MAG: transglutaminase domain-containing protein [Clostridium sp.]|uniref:transglutaminase domain-containing protein n=1 Tax=Clostridium sp. TaxID=1506 RepID=UPI003D6CF483